MICKNCGSNLDDKAIVCNDCGTPVNTENSTNNQTNVKSKKVKGIISFILGIIAFFFILITFLALDVPLASVANKSFSFKLIYILFFNILSIIPAIIGLILSHIERKKQHNIFNTIGLFLGLATLILVIIQSAYIIIA